MDTDLLKAIVGKAASLAEAREFIELYLLKPPTIEGAAFPVGVQAPMPPALPKLSPRGKGFTRKLVPVSRANKRWTAEERQAVIVMFNTDHAPGRMHRFSEATGRSPASIRSMMEDAGLRASLNAEDRLIAANTKAPKG